MTTPSTYAIINELSAFTLERQTRNAEEEQ